ARLPEARRRQLQEVAVLNHLHAAAEEGLVRAAEDGVEGVDGGERLHGTERERTDRDGVVLRGGGDSAGETEQERNCRFHRASPNPRRAARASMSPKPY